jgi:hypothetical protein
MPQTTIPARLDELRRMTAHDIVEALGEARLPSLPRVDAPTVDVAAVELPRFDIGKAVHSAAVAANLRPRTRSRDRVVRLVAVSVLLAVVATILWAVVRPRLVAPSDEIDPVSDDLTEAPADLARVVTDETEDPVGS